MFRTLEGPINLWLDRWTSFPLRASERLNRSRTAREGKKPFIIKSYLGRGGLIIVRHLQAGPLEAALDVEALVGLAAVEDALVAADLFGDRVEGLDDAQAEFLALLVLRHGDVLDVPDQAHVVDELALDNDRARAHHRRRLVADHQDVVRVVARRDEVVPRVEFRLRRLAHRREHPERREVACYFSVSSVQDLALLFSSFWLVVQVLSAQTMVALFLVGKGGGGCLVIPGTYLQSNHSSSRAGWYIL